MTEGSRGEGSQKEEIMAFEHISVLLYETVDGLNVKPGWHLCGCNIRWRRTCL